MEKLIKVEFIEQSKAVVANTKIEVTSEDVNYEDVLEEAKDLFNKASEYSSRLTMRKMTR